MINFCPRCGSKAIRNNGSTSDYGGLLFIADDTGSSLEFASSCGIFSCEECGKETIIECEDDFNYDF